MVAATEHHSRGDYIIKLFICTHMESHASYIRGRLQTFNHSMSGGQRTAAHSQQPYYINYNF
jgi:hypothetical protein